MTIRPLGAPAAELPPTEAASGVPERFQAGDVTTIAGGHFVHDSFSAFIAPLLPKLQERLGTGYAATGGLVIFLQLPSLLNPFIGYAADKVSLRYFIILAPAVTATLCSALGLANTYVLSALLLFAAGVSVAAFHAPAPAMIGRISGPKVGAGMSIFMASGELGRTVGPLIVIAAVGWWGLEGIWRLAVVGWLFSGFLYWRLHDISARVDTRPALNVGQMWPRIRRIFPPLLWILASRVLLAVALTTFLPLFMRDEVGVSFRMAGISLSVLEGAGVVGALSTGTLSDRIGRGRILVILFSLAPLFYFAFLWAPPRLALPLLVALGLTAISPTPVLMALVQDYFPENRALANGLFLTANFLTRSLGISVLGALADLSGLHTAFLWSGVVALLTVPAVFWLPQRNAIVGG